MNIASQIVQDAMSVDDAIEAALGEVGNLTDHVLAGNGDEAIVSVKIIEGHLTGTPYAPPVDAPKQTVHDPELEAAQAQIEVLTDQLVEAGVIDDPTPVDEPGEVGVQPTPVEDLPTDPGAPLGAPDQPPIQVDPNAPVEPTPVPGDETAPSGPISGPDQPPFESEDGTVIDTSGGPDDEPVVETPPTPDPLPNPVISPPDQPPFTTDDGTVIDPSNDPMTDEVSPADGSAVTVGGGEVVPPVSAPDTAPGSSSPLPEDVVDPEPAPAPEASTPDVGDLTAPLVDGDGNPVNPPPGDPSEALPIATEPIAPGDPVDVEGEPAPVTATEPIAAGDEVQVIDTAPDSPPLPEGTPVDADGNLVTQTEGIQDLGQPEPPAQP